jgi:hypothetical protein
MIRNEFDPINEKLMHLQAVLDVQQMEIDVLKELRLIQKRQINTLTWAYGILASLYFMSVINIMGW